MAATNPDPTGLDLARLTTWFSTSVPGSGSDLSATLVAGGKSNLTYEVTDGRATWIVRRPPLGHVLATAHDMAREFRVMSALQATEVPVPRTYALCEDPDVVGAPFFVMERVDGTPYRCTRDLEPLGPRRTRMIAAGLVDTLAALHRVEPDSVGLADFGRPEKFLARQVSRWKRQLDASYSRELPTAEELYARLAADVPQSAAASIVHGDYRLDNVLINSQGRPAAVIDWEMATLGDPITYLALLVVYQRLGSLLSGNGVADAASAPGFLSEREIVERYAAGSVRDLSRFGFYLGLASFKLAVIVEGIYYRHVKGQTVGSGFENLGETVVPLLDAGLTSLKEQY